MIKVESSIFILHSSGMCSSPVWAEGLKKRGTYYEGYVEDLEGTLESHRRDTVTTWGIHRSAQRKQPTPGETDKENKSAKLVSPQDNCLCNIYS